MSECGPSKSEAEERFDLGTDELWNFEIELLPPPPKKKKLSLSLKHKVAETSRSFSGSRFESPKKSLATYQKPFCPENTKINTRWALKNFEDWAASYNERHPESQCPPGVLLSDDAEELSTWLQRLYVLGMRKANGEKYPPCTLQLLFSAIQQYMCDNKVRPFHIFSDEFRKLSNTCDTYYHEVREEGVDSASKPTEVFTASDLNKLWDSGVLNPHTPQGLLNAVFFYNGLNFLLRSGVEHRALKLSQLSKNTSLEGRVRYTYTENAFEK